MLLNMLSIKLIIFKKNGKSETLILTLSQSAFYRFNVKILLEERQTELVVKKSRFIAIARKCETLNRVKELVDETRALHPAANHVVHAAVIGTQFSFSDDHEPKGTAGRPALEVLKGSGISNICILIVRYFGGTLLGTGGLVKAYGDSAKMVLDGIIAEEYVEKTNFSLKIEYQYYDSIKKLLEESKAENISEKFETGISISGCLPADNFEKLRSAVSDITKGQCILEK